MGIPRESHGSGNYRGNRNGNRVNGNGREWEFCFVKEIPTPSDSYLIYNYLRITNYNNLRNLQIEFIITVAQAGYYFFTFYSSTDLMKSMCSSTTKCIFHLCLSTC